MYRFKEFKGLIFAQKSQLSLLRCLLVAFVLNLHFHLQADSVLNNNLKQLVSNQVTSQVYLEELNSLFYQSWSSLSEAEKKLPYFSIRMKKEEVRALHPKAHEYFKKAKELNFKNNKIKIELSQAIYSNPELREKLNQNGFYFHSFEKPVTIASWKNSKSMRAQVNEVCLHPLMQLEEPSLDRFLKLKQNSLSCATKVNEAKLIIEPSESLNKKIEVLTGGFRIPDEVFEKAEPDPNFPLNFSQAPQLDAIYLFYLEYKHDFSGRMIAQAIRHHALKGTKVYIILPSAPLPAFIKKKDAALLKELTSFSNNILLQKVRYKTEYPDLTDGIKTLHRVLHTKIFVTLSSTQPEANVVITGGRNIKDTFIFKKTPKFSDPNMIQYNNGDERFRPFDDLEVLIKNKHVANQVASQIKSFINRDPRTYDFSQTTAHLDLLKLDKVESNTVQRDLLESVYVRHNFSVPYKDKKEAKDIIVEFINSAQHEILITTPYFYPPAAINRALKKAHERGVKIIFVTQTDHSGDENYSLVGDINRTAVNKLFTYADIYDWKQASIMHSKSMLIDNKVLYVGTINFLIRSFDHDLENGFYFTGPEVIQSYRDLFFNTYVKNSEKVEEKQYVNILNRLLILLGRPFI